MFLNNQSPLPIRVWKNFWVATRFLHMTLCVYDIFTITFISQAQGVSSFARTFLRASIMVNYDQINHELKQMQEEADL